MSELQEAIETVQDMLDVVEQTGSGYVYAHNGGKERLENIKKQLCILQDIKNRSERWRRNRMAKKRIKSKVTNKKMDAACDYLHKRIKLVLPYIYSAIALALWNILDETEEEKYNDIAMLIEESQTIWNQCVEEGKNIADWCEEVTGFDIRNGVS